MTAKSKHQGVEALPGNNEHVPTRAVLYARVSSEEQRERQTIQTQIESAHQYCQQHNLPLMKIYQDDGVSGTVPFKKRDGGKRLLDDARQKQFDTLLVYKIDRLGRNTLETLLAANELEALHVTVQSMTEPFDTTTPHGRFMLNQFASFAQLERDNIRERSIAGVERTARAGRWLGGYPPRGYKITADRKLMPDDDLVRNGNGMNEVELIQTIYRWIGDEQCSTYAVAERLNERQIPVAHVKRGHRWGGSGKWMPRTIAGIVNSPLYRGEHVFRRRYNKAGTQEYRYAVPALVTPDLWQRTQQVIAANWHHKRTTSHREYLLRGLVRCSICGLGMSGMSVRKVVNSKDYWYFLYRCHGKKEELTWLHGRCPSRFVPAEKLEQTVWDELTRWILDGASLDKAIAKALKDVRGECEQMKQRLAKMRTRLESLEKERQRVIALCRQGVIDEHDLERQLTEVAHERQTLQQTVTALEQQLSRDADPHAALAHLHAHLARFQRAVRKGTLAPTDKRKIIESLVTEVRVFGTSRKKNTEVPLIQQTIPWRATLPPEPQGEGKKTVWQRNGATPGPKDGREKVQIIYAFPFTPAERTVSILSGTVGERSVQPGKLALRNGQAVDGS